MSFRIIGDEIEYDYRPVARFIVPASCSARYHAEADIKDCDPEVAADARAQEIKALDDDYRKTIDDLESKVDELEAENKKLYAIVYEIDNGGTLHEIATRAEAEAAEWRAKAQAYADEIRRLNAPKPRRRKSR